MSRYTTQKGKIFGDFEVVAGKGAKKVVCKCRNCGHEKIFARSTIHAGNPAKCPRCNVMYGQTRAIAKYPERKVTKDTKKLICWYYAEGDSIEEIVILLHRNEDMVIKILTESIENGKYTEYVFLSECIDQAKAYERMRDFEKQTKEIKRTAVLKKKRRKNQA